jgi:hypothetical protein
MKFARLDLEEYHLPTLRQTLLPKSTSGNNTQHQFERKPEITVQSVPQIPEFMYQQQPTLPIINQTNNQLQQKLNQINTNQFTNTTKPFSSSPSISISTFNSQNNNFSSVQAMNQFTDSVFNQKIDDVYEEDMNMKRRSRSNSRERTTNGRSSSQEISQSRENNAKGKHYTFDDVDPAEVVVYSSTNTKVNLKEVMLSDWDGFKKECGTCFNVISPTVIQVRNKDGESKIVAWAKKKGFSKMVLNVFKHNTIAYSMYQNCGFKVIEDYGDSVIMEKVFEKKD